MNYHEILIDTPDGRQLEVGTLGDRSGHTVLFRHGTPVSAKPVAVWFGDHDLMVPRTHGEWLIEKLPSASPHFFVGDGHVSLVVNHLDELSAAIKKTYV